jgi:putative hydrolase of the HAD superfamily
MTNRENHLAIIRQSSRAIEPLPTGESASLKPLHGIEAVLLDVYGTLFISSSGDIGTGDDVAHSAAFRQALLDVGLYLRADGAEGVQCLRKTIEDCHGRSRQRGIEFPEVDIVEVWRATLRSLQQRGQLAGDTENVDVAALSLRHEPCLADAWSR